MHCDHNTKLDSQTTKAEEGRCEMKTVLVEREVAASNVTVPRYLAVSYAMRTQQGDLPRPDA